MKDVFSQAVEFALLPEHDGQGYHCSPMDTGGATAWGIIRPTLATYLGKFVSDVTNEDIRALTKQSVIPIYRKLFWEKLCCDKLPPALGFMLFDFACGTTEWSVVRLQRLVRAKEDGVMGPKTVAAVNAAWDKQGPALLLAYHQARKNYYDQVPNHEHWPGWYKRADRCFAQASKLVSS